MIQFLPVEAWSSPRWWGPRRWLSSSTGGPTGAANATGGILANGATRGGRRGGRLILKRCRKRHSLVDFRW